MPPISTPISSPVLYPTLVLYVAATVAYYFGLRRDTDKDKRRCLRLLIAAFACHSIDISWRAMHHVHPGFSVGEALGFLAWVVAGIFWLASTRHHLPIVGIFVSAFSTITLAIARWMPMNPGEWTMLGRIHIALAMVGVAIFALAAGVAVVRLLAEASLHRKRFDAVSFRRSVPLETLDALGNRLVILGFPIFTLSLLLGIVWVVREANYAFRLEYSISVVSWLSFCILLVARSALGWRGKKAAWLTIAGFSASLLVLAIYMARRMS